MVVEAFQAVREGPPEAAVDHPVAEAAAEGHDVKASSNEKDIIFFFACFLRAFIKRTNRCGCITVFPA